MKKDEMNLRWILGEDLTLSQRTKSAQNEMSVNELVWLEYVFEDS